MTAPLLDKINADFIVAMKARDEGVVSTLRMLKSAVQYKGIEGSAKRELTDAEVLDVLTKQGKQRRESIDAFVKGGRQDLADKEKAELAIIERYLPAQMSEAEILKIVKDAIAAVGAASVKDMGKVMAVVTPQLKGKADMGKVSAFVKAQFV
jgi:hypothetical protein